MPVIHFETRHAGAAPGDQIPPFIADLPTGELTLRDLITRAVDEQVRVVHAQWLGDLAATRRVMDRQYLTQSEIDARAKAGAVTMPAALPAAPPGDVTTAAADALHAFERQRYVVYVDGRQITDLDDLVPLRLGSKVTFLRLVPLVGG